MNSSEGWDSVNSNYRLRLLQPDILINNRRKMQEDFLTPEERITPADGAYWEACMTFNGLSWGYIDSEQALPYSYTPQKILSMLTTCTIGGGNLLLNIGPTPDGESGRPMVPKMSILAANGRRAECSAFSFLIGYFLKNARFRSTSPSMPSTVPEAEYCQRSK